MQREGKRVLGQDAQGPIVAGEIDTVPWSHGEKDAVVEFTTDELTAICPVTGQPDFYDLKLTYRPKERLLESKAMKLYLWGFRDEGAFAEDLAATLLEDLVAACEPAEMTVDLTQRVRGGLQIRTVVRHAL
ncbi:MAG: preQ(1) synthase [Actinomycetota bacterium]|nr:preQ(1) synthase [Actinomycetota bacterium]